MTFHATLYDVAREAGVSLATASRVLNGSARIVSDRYRDRVLFAAEQLAYTPNQSAQNVARGASSTVALLISDMTDPYFSTIAAGVLRSAEVEGLFVTIAVTDRNNDREIELVRLLRRQRPRIIVLVGSRFTDEGDRHLLIAELQAFSDAGGKVVLVSQAELPFATVEIDNVGGARALARSLMSLGYRRFVVLAGPENLIVARDRVSSFQAELEANGISSTSVHGSFTREGGYAQMNSVLDMVDVPDFDLVFAVNDIMAVGALSALRDRKIDVATVGVAGFDDILAARDVTPTLTTVRVPLEEVGEKVLALGLGTSFGAAPVMQVETTVIIRDSTPRR